MESEKWRIKYPKKTSICVTVQVTAWHGQLVEGMSRFQVRTPRANKVTEVSTVHTFAFSVSQKRTTGENVRNSSKSHVE